MRGLPGSSFAAPSIHYIVDAATAAQRYVAGASQGQARFVEGVQNTQKDPTALAIAAQNKMLANVTAAITSGKYARGLSRVGKQGWITATVAKAANYSVGVQAGASKYEQAIGPVLQQIASLQSQINQMPNGSFQDSIARMVAFSTGLHNWAQSR
ncbi:MAG TPA: hypothetical protein VNC18_17570 [Gemmatimonadaceae bacterium]|jgi:hypothetical protein|nr:hypothetical protein [Gemmatimonadaceae bacterium]